MISISLITVNNMLHKWVSRENKICKAISKVMLPPPVVPPPPPPPQTQVRWLILQERSTSQAQVGKKCTQWVSMCVFLYVALYETCISQPPLNSPVTQHTGLVKEASSWCSEAKTMPRFVKMWNKCTKYSDVATKLLCTLCSECSTVAVQAVY